MYFKNRILILKTILFLGIAILSCTQPSKKFEDYAGLWKGQSNMENPFEIDISISDVNQPKATIVLSNGKELFRKAFTLKDTLTIPLDEGLHFEGLVNKNKTQIKGFVKLGTDFYPIQLQKKDDAFKGVFNLSAIPYFQSEALYLQIRNVYNSVEYEAYPVLGTYWVSDFKIENNQISFKDFKTKLVFKGKLEHSKMTLSVNLGAVELGTITYKEVKGRDKGTVLTIEDGWKETNQKLQLPKLEQDITTNQLKGVESVMVAKDGKIYYENYFGGTNSTTTNDIRSAGKSIGSAMIGIAIDDRIISSIDENVFDFIPEAYQYTKDEEKAKITIKHLLTMSSGIGVYEDYYQETDDWLKTVLEPKLKYNAGTRTNYMSADPFLLSVNLSERLGYPLEFYMQQKLFEPLQISNYILNSDDKGKPYFAGGLNLTPRAMLKFGQLYLDKGVWNGKRIISEEWVTASLKKHTKLENTTKKNAYGYFWWHDTYTVNGKEISAVEARGNGGQYISIISELNLVIVVTTANYNKRGAAQQTEKIIQDYVLSNVLNEE